MIKNKFVALESQSFFTAFLLVMVLIVASCKKKDENKNCLAIVVPETLRFKIVDKTTGKDLFFSDPVTYPIDQIYAVVNDMAANTKPTVKTVSSTDKHFELSIGAGPGSGSLKIFIQNQLAFTIAYTMKLDDSSGCSQYKFDKLTINNDQVESNIKERVIFLRR